MTGETSRHTGRYNVFDNRGLATLQGENIELEELTANNLFTLPLPDLAQPSKNCYANNDVEACIVCTLGDERHRRPGNDYAKLGQSYQRERLRGLDFVLDLLWTAEENGHRTGAARRWPGTRCMCMLLINLSFLFLFLHIFSGPSRQVQWLLYYSVIVCLL